MSESVVVVVADQAVFTTVCPYLTVTQQSSGRGGLGNMRALSSSIERPVDGPDDFSIPRGREPTVQTAHVYSTGRGGAGNMRSPSRDVDHVGPDAREREIVNEYERRESIDAVHSSGRGGLGNMSRSRSRGPQPSNGPVSPIRRLTSVGRGGIGNIQEGDGIEANLLDEEERRLRAQHDSAVHSTGRGGIANMAHSPVPGVEQVQRKPSEGFQSTGRGGAGNMRDRSGSRGPDQRNKSQDGKNRLTELLHKVTHPRDS
ncbi:hypothetical protein CYLTODRAFT_430286 [Cylindrobasidium torrendii FP15055 ss-10]|uniref:Uncharacterized protein n=1 Tax=Cylindrobasidium torrendii FP15055 ss-10 TaxID=1314674 RepID=A0A0D7BGR0_9AGAR|nr:hypothetical protein CYLTODRAFT_430286 [Cylindrobasidium torrendii FP15055 ss-10]